MSTKPRSATQAESDDSSTEQYEHIPSGNWDTLDEDRHPVATEMISERYDPDTVGELTAPRDIVSKYQNFEDEGGSRPSILGHQVPAEVAQAVMSEMELNPLYKFERDRDHQAAWQIGDTTQALVISRLDDEIRMQSLPYLGETNLDLRWMMIHTLARDDEFDITFCSPETVESILKVTRPEDAPAIEQLLYSRCAEDCTVPPAVTN